MKKIKKILACSLAVALAVPAVACGKNDNEDNGKIKIYDLIEQAELGTGINEVRLIGDKLYSVYFEGVDDTEDTVSGLIVYDMKTKDKKQVQVGEKNSYVNNIYMDKDGNIVVNSYEQVSADKINSNAKEESKESEELEESEEVMAHIEYSYDSDMKLVSTGEYEEIENYDDSEMYWDNNGNSISSYIDEEGNTGFKLIDQEGLEVGSIEADVENGAINVLADGTIIYSEIGEENNKLSQIDFDDKELDELAGGKEFDFEMIGSADEESIYGIDGDTLVKVDKKKGSTRDVLKFMDSGVAVGEINTIFEDSDGDISVVTTDDAGVSRVSKFEESENQDTNKTVLTMGVFYLDSELQSRVMDFNKNNDKYKIEIKSFAKDINDYDEYSEALTEYQNYIDSDDCPDIINCNAGFDIDKLMNKGCFDDLKPYFGKDSELNLENFVQSVVKTYTVDDKIFMLPNKFVVSGLMGASEKLTSGYGWSLDDYIAMSKEVKEDQYLLEYDYKDSLLEILSQYMITNKINWTENKLELSEEELSKFMEFLSGYNSSEEMDEVSEEDDGENEILEGNEADENDIDQDDAEGGDLDIDGLEAVDENGEPLEIELSEDNEELDMSELFGEEVYDEMNEIVDNIKTGKQILTQFNLTDINEYLIYKKFYGGSVNVKGYPSTNTNGIVVIPCENLFAISSKSENKDAAWEFIRAFYLDESETEDALNDYGFSIIKSKVEERLAASKTPETYEDEEGITQTIDNIVTFGSEDFDLGYPSDEDIKFMSELIDAADTRDFVSYGSLEIFSDYANQYFADELDLKYASRTAREEIEKYIKK